jgi:hypothetical protein
MILMGLMLIISPVLATDYLEQDETYVEKFYSLDGLEIKRTFVSEDTQGLDLITDEIVPIHRSKMTIRIINTGIEDKNDVILKESLVYLPANARIEFDPQPQSNGRTVTWRIAKLGPKDLIDITYIIDALVPKSAVLNLPAPAIEYDITKAMLIAPKSVNVGEKIELTLLDELGRDPIKDAIIMVTNPQSAQIKVKTDRSGKAIFVATQKGAYRFASSDYQLIRSDTTYSISPQKEDEDVDGEKEDKQSSEGFDALLAVGTLFSLWPIAAAALIAIIVLVLLFNFFNSPVEEEQIPAAPATRPSINDESQEEDDRSETEKLTIDSSIPTEDQSIIKEFGQEKKTHPPQIPDYEQNDTDESLESLTQDLLAKRRQLQKEEESEDENSRGFDFEADEQQSMEQTTEIDDEAIKKTIEELEQLRSELKETEKKLSDEEQIDYQDVLPEEDQEELLTDDVKIPQADEIDVEAKIKEDMQKLLLPQDDEQVIELTKKIDTKKVEKKAKKKSSGKKKTVKKEKKKARRPATKSVTKKAAAKKKPKKSKKKR